MFQFGLAAACGAQILVLEIFVATHPLNPTCSTYDKATMLQHGILTYIRLKIIVTLIRLLVRFRDRPTAGRLRSDRVQTAKYGVQPDKIHIPSREPKHSIAADVYEYSGASELEKKPVLINWHGSGFFIPLHGSDALFCAQIARELGVVVIDADYRKAPEDPFPAAINDVEDVLRWLETQGGRFDLSRIAVSGFSAGGNLALVASSSLRKKFTKLDIRAVFAMYPVTDISIAPEAKSTRKPRRPISPWLAGVFNDCYVPNKEMRTDPRVSPRLADPNDYPSTAIILTCEGDTLEPEGTSLAEKLKDGKRTVVYDKIEGMHHGFDKGCEPATQPWKERETAYALVSVALKGALGI